uniref:Uncharacterized protein n=1 Tax=Anguilla anguilla TaxID=7936 RepID=A0A0E9U2U2_ANGAN
MPSEMFASWTISYPSQWLQTEKLPGVCLHSKSILMFNTKMVY